MKVIYKYRLPIADITVLTMPYDHKLLSVQNQNGEICLWALSDPKEDEFRTRTFRIFGTGNESERLENTFDMQFLGTVQTGPYVWHVFVDLIDD